MYFEKERYTLQRLSPADVNRIEKNSSVKCRFGSCPSLPTPKRFEYGCGNRGNGMDNQSHVLTIMHGVITLPPYSRVLKATCFASDKSARFRMRPDLGTFRH
ncbi:hypothetical protein OUZ56_031014 [Daphnia magna]|uniref:Uncharacterized protein n=1 Tax=Daphnia magna TaxID=35525 RepID=A0ABQ9ZSZ9_9CRUS|nr:hypothetical protein OUZ56_031014 [Daphnia magna]